MVTSRQSLQVSPFPLTCNSCSAHSLKRAHASPICIRNSIPLPPLFPTISLIINYLTILPLPTQEPILHCFVIVVFAFGSLYQNLRFFFFGNPGLSVFFPLPPTLFLYAFFFFSQASPLRSLDLFRSLPRRRPSGLHRLGRYIFLAASSASRRLLLQLCSIKNLCRMRQNV